MSSLNVSTVTKLLFHTDSGIDSGATSGLDALASSLGFAEGGVTVDLDASFIVQTIILVALVFILKPLLFDPMMRLFEAREQRTEGRLGEARDLDKKSAVALAEYETILAKAREAGATERDALRAEGIKKEATLMADVREATGRTIEQGRTQIAGEASAARQELRADANVLGRQIASRVLGREVTS